MNLNLVLAKLCLLFVACFSLVNVATATTTTMSIRNVAVENDTLTFDIYARNDGSLTAWLTDCSFYVAFNHDAFSSPELIVESGEGKLSQLSRYQYSTGIVNNILAVELVHSKTVTSKVTAEAFCEVMKTTGDGTRIASVKVSGRTGFQGTTELGFNTANPFISLVFCYVDDTPFTTTPTIFTKEYAPTTQVMLGPVFEYELRNQEIHGNSWFAEVYARALAGPNYNVGTTALQLESNADVFTSSSPLCENTSGSRIDEYYAKQADVDASNSLFDFVIAPPSVDNQVDFAEKIQTLPSDSSWVRIAEVSASGFDIQQSILDIGMAWSDATEVNLQRGEPTWSPSADITDNGTFLIEAPLVDLSGVALSDGNSFYCDGEDITVIWQSTNLSLVDIYLSDGATETLLANDIVADSGSFTWTIEGITYGNEYRIVVRDNARPQQFVDSISNSFATYAPIELIEHPSSTIVCLGDTAVFIASASGVPTPTYQWQVSITGEFWSDIDGATDSIYRVEAIDSRDGFSYRVKCTNNCGSTVSEAALLDIAFPTKITVHPQTQVVCEGEDVVFATAVQANPSGQIRWQLNTGQGWSDEGTIGDTLRFDNVGRDLDGVTIRARIIQYCGDTLTQEAELNVLTAPEVTVYPVPDTVCEGETAEFVLEVDANPLPAIQWQYSANAGGPWTNFAGETGQVLAINNTQREMHLQYIRAVIANTCGEIATPNVWTVVRFGPEIVQQPSATTVCEGDAATFSALISSRPGHSLQWQELVADQWENLPGANANVLTVSEATLDDHQSQFRLRAIGTCLDTVYSDIAQLNVMPLPAILAELQDVNVCEGNNALFTTEVFPTTATVQWQQRRPSESIWVNISGATELQLLLSNVGTHQDGNSYRVRVQTPCGEEYSNVSELAVDPIVKITQQPQSVTVLPTETAVFSASASETAVTWQWYKEGNALFDDGRISGSQTAELRISNVSVSDASSAYYAVVSEGCGSDTTALAALNIDVPEIDINEHPNGVEVCALETIEFSVAASTSVSSATLEYQWYRDGNALTNSGNVSGAQSPTLTIEVVSESNQSNGYACKVTAVPGGRFEFSQTASLIVNNKPQLTGQSEDQDVCRDDVIVLAVEATSDSPEELQYQWFHDDAMVQGANTRVVEEDATELTEGLWHCVVTNSCGSVVGEPIEVRLLAPTTAVLIGESTRHIDSGQSTVLRVESAGSGILRYQWYFNDLEIEGANRDSLVLLEVAPFDEGEYYCIVAGECGEAKSETFMIVVNEVSVPSTLHRTQTLRVFPNPASSTIRIDIPSDIQAHDSFEAQIVDVAGQIVQSVRITHNSNEVNVASLPSGLYILVLHTGSEILSTQLLISH